SQGTLKHAVTVAADGLRRTTIARRDHRGALDDSWSVSKTAERVRPVRLGRGSPHAGIRRLRYATIAMVAAPDPTVRDARERDALASHPDRAPGDNGASIARRQDRSASRSSRVRPTARSASPRAAS